MRSRLPTDFELRCLAADRAHAARYARAARPGLARALPRDAARDAAEVAAAWDAYACGARLDTKIRTIHGPRPARVLFRLGTWVVTLREGATALTLGPLGMAVPVPGADREALVDLAETIVAAGFGDVVEVSPELGKVVEAWSAGRAPEAA